MNWKPQEHESALSPIKPNFKHVVVRMGKAAIARGSPTLKERQAVQAA